MGGLAQYILGAKQKMSENAVIVLGFVLPCLMTTLGAVLVFFFRRTSRVVNMIPIGLAAGIMLSASFWSLLVPALENAKADWGNLAFLPVVLGFVLGGLMMLLMDFVSNRLYREKGGKTCHSDGSGADGRISTSRSLKKKKVPEPAEILRLRRKSASAQDDKRRSEIKFSGNPGRSG